MHILIDFTLPETQAEQIQQLAPQIRLVRLPAFGKPIPRDDLKDADVIYTAAANFDPTDAPRLRWVQTPTAAINALVGKPILRSPIPVANVSGAYSVAVAECAMGMLLALTRRITLGVREQLQHRWPDHFAPWIGEDLYGKTMGIVGYGSIGRQIARLATAMGMTVLACKRRPDQRRDDSYLLPGTGDPEGVLPKAWFGQDQLIDLFRQSVVAMITLPDAPGTRRLIDAPALSALPRHAMFVNVGRGAVVDEAALIDVLRSGAIAGAALDVFAEEPLPPGSPFWEMPNVLVMPHIASATTGQAERAAGVLYENVRRDLAGWPLINLIDKNLLY